MCFYDVQHFADTVKVFVDRKDLAGALARALQVASRAIECAGKQDPRNQSPMWVEAAQAYATAGDVAFDLAGQSDAPKYWQLSNTYYEKVLADPKQDPGEAMDFRAAIMVNDDKLGLPTPAP
jgi:hypothetical protein